MSIAKPKKRAYGIRGEDERRATALRGRLSRRDVQTSIRRLGHISAKMHEAVMANLVANNDSEVAEEFNDAFKPLVDALLGFELEVHDGEV